MLRSLFRQGGHPQKCSLIALRNLLGYFERLKWGVPSYAGITNPQGESSGGLGAAHAKGANNARFCSLRQGNHVWHSLSAIQQVSLISRSIVTKSL